MKRNPTSTKAKSSGGIASRIYPTKAEERAPVDGWAKQRADWGENIDHI
jgi:hypothetical protein